ncbi:hypothetical protein E3N88_10918 [Mikania micrantha]|uniref:Uncharacterized protein n=1 Tax=Mikania micrantha TaxID=192012 RepID=A0A5N6PE90_9ASTR|nr:hypothetical protein E3N88_10918 [Mikania micrantha]
MKEVMAFTCPLFLRILLLRLLFLITLSNSQSIVKTLPGYHGDLPFKLETGYIGVGENEEVELFYYFAESLGNPEEDPIILNMPGGPGYSGLYSFAYGREGPLSLNDDNGPYNITLTLNPNSWTKVANMIFVDIPAGVGYSYAKTKEGWISSDTNMATQATAFIKKFLINHPMFLNNPLYIAGISYMGIINPLVTLQLYEGNEHGDQPSINIQGYILCGPLTDKFMDFNSRFEFAHRMALISDDVYKSALENCDGNYLNTNTTNSPCAHSLQQYEECTRNINLDNTLEPPCDELNPMPYCPEYCDRVFFVWANSEVVQQALHIRKGTIGIWKLHNSTMHYSQGKNDTFCYSYDIFSSFPHHKKLVDKHCRALVFSGDHDMTFPYVGAEQWIASLNLSVERPWAPFFVNDHVGGYETRYAQNEFSLTFATVIGAGHSVPVFKPEEAMEVVHWISPTTITAVTGFLRSMRTKKDARRLPADLSAMPLTYQSLWEKRFGEKADGDFIHIPDVE